MFGSGILKGLGVTLRRYTATFTDDFSRHPTRYANSIETSKGLIVNQPTDVRGIFTIQYPEERRELPENFRYIPMLLYEEDTGEDRCTACGICAKVCPPQCIWIVRDQDENGKPITRPRQFFIDASICMSCGFCAEYCPFDAIKMNHDYELATYDRFPGLVFDKTELSVPTGYYAALYPKTWAEKEAGKVKKGKKGGGAKAEAKKPAAAAEKPAAKVEAAPAQQPAPVATAATAAVVAEAAPRPKPKGGHYSPIPEGYTGEILRSSLPLPAVPAEGVSPSGVPWAQIMEMREKQLLHYRERRKAEGKEVKL